MQALKYKWLTKSGGFEPTLFLSDRKEIRRISLMNSVVSLSLGNRYCVGYFSGGRHVECPEKRAVHGEWACNECKLNDDFFMCMKCDGSECINQKQRQACSENNYFIYLAAFDSMLKVGISYHFRLLERLIEQGADFGAKIAAVKDGKDVRTVERYIKSYLKIADRVTGAQKQGLLFCNPNVSVQNINSSISLLRNNGIAKYMVAPEIYDLRNYYGLENVHYHPAPLKVSDGMKIEGRVVAAKGNIVVIKNDDRFVSFNAHDLIGREIVEI